MEPEAEDSLTRPILHPWTIRLGARWLVRHALGVAVWRHRGGGAIPMVLQVNKAYRGHRERLPSNPSESADKMDIYRLPAKQHKLGLSHSAKRFAKTILNPHAKMPKYVVKNRAHSHIFTHTWNHSSSWPPVPPSLQGLLATTFPLSIRLTNLTGRRRCGEAGTQKQPAAG